MSEHSSGFWRVAAGAGERETSSGSGSLQRTKDTTRFPPAARAFRAELADPAPGGFGSKVQPGFQPLRLPDMVVQHSGGPTPPDHIRRPDSHAPARTKA
ncbi:MAG: hypothetical protein JJU19_15430 [Pararhodobacter sp.]|nr:hypothetical protein [Pararhodobacter sp.]